MVAIDMQTWDTKTVARARYDERQRNEQKHRKPRKSTNRAIGLDNRSSANGVNTSRARRVVETVGNLALDRSVDDYAASETERMYRLFASEAGEWTDYPRDIKNAPLLAAGAYRIRLDGEIYRVSISEPFQMDNRWRTVVTFDEFTCVVKFGVTLAQLSRVLDFLRIVEPPKWEPSASALRWTACMVGAAKHCAYHMAYDLSTCAAEVDTSGLFRIVAGYVVEI